MNKKNGKTTMTCSLFLIAILLFGTQFVSSVAAKKPSLTYDSADEYTFIVGKLDGADYGLLMPDNWNGMLIIMCRGHMTEMPSIILSPVGIMFMTGANTVDDNGKRFAFAWSNYGEGGYCIKAGVKRIHQLTKYIIGKYHVTGKVFLMSISMGGAISLTLAEKYPNLYSGVADFSGVKDLAASYAHKTSIAALATSLDKRSGLISYFEGPPASIDSADLLFLTDPTWTGSTLIPDAYKDDTEVSAYIDGAGETAEEMETECGGTPAEKPKAYDRRSPIDNPEISVPIIIVHGTADTQVPYSQSVAYRDAVNAITEPDLCRLYPVPHAGHTSMSVYMQMITRFKELVIWSNTIDPP